MMTAHEAIVRSYPHSLIEALVTGKPVLVSRSVPMADYVEQAGCGVVVEQAEHFGLAQLLPEACEGELVERAEVPHHSSLRWRPVRLRKRSSRLA